jgi:hypothetical protein
VAFKPLHSNARVDIQGKDFSVAFCFSDWTTVPATTGQWRIIFGMVRAPLFILLLASVTTFVHAQRGAGMTAAHRAIEAVHPNVSGYFRTRGHSHGFVRTPETGHAHHPGDGYGYGAFPYFLPDYETGWPDEEQRSPEPDRAPLLRVHDEADREPGKPLPAQVIVISNTTKSSETKPLPATVFVLTNGERLETRRYLLTANSVSLTLHRNQRTIPIKMLDLDATIAENRDRGLDLRIPNDRSEISLRF